MVLYSKVCLWQMFDPESKSNTLFYYGTISRYSQSLPRIDRGMSSTKLKK